MVFPDFNALPKNICHFEGLRFGFLGAERHSAMNMRAFAPKIVSPATPVLTSANSALNSAMVLQCFMPHLISSYRERQAKLIILG